MRKNTKKDPIYDAMHMHRQSIDKIIKNSDSDIQDFLEKLSNTHPEPSLIEILKLKWKELSGIFISLISITFILTRFTMPVTHSFKGIEDNNSNDVQDTQIIKLIDNNEYIKIINELVNKEIAFSIESSKNFKKIYIKSLEKKEISGLNISNDNEGPVTIILTR